MIETQFLMLGITKTSRELDKPRAERRHSPRLKTASYFILEALTDEESGETKCI